MRPGIYKSKLDKKNNTQINIQSYRDQEAPEILAFLTFRGDWRLVAAAEEPSLES